LKAMKEMKAPRLPETPRTKGIEKKKNKRGEKRGTNERSKSPKINNPRGEMKRGKGYRPHPQKTRG